MNLLANENFPRQAVEALRADGHNVLWVRTDMVGAQRVLAPQPVAVAIVAVLGAFL